eukprot:13902318-Alexandrium_andersonii.AAC.1
MDCVAIWGPLATKACTSRNKRSMKMVAGRPTLPAPLRRSCALRLCRRLRATGGRRVDTRIHANTHAHLAPRNR